MSNEKLELEKILAERGSNYGDYGVMSDFAQRLKTVIKSQHKFEYMPPEMKESLELMCTKIARIMVGDHNVIDSWQDIAGYADLIAKRLKERRGIPTPPPSFVGQRAGAPIPPQHPAGAPGHHPDGVPVARPMPWPQVDIDEKLKVTTGRAPYA